MKATNVASTLGRVNVKRLPADAQRSLAQRFNAWAKEYGIEVEEEKPTPKVASPIKPIVQKEKPMSKVTLDLNDPVQRKVAEMFGLIETEPTPIKRAPKPKPKPEPETNGFIEHLADLHARNVAAGRVCKVKHVRGRKRGQPHGDFSADGWVFHRKWCNGKVAR